MKMDAEGAEPEVLMGAVKVLASCDGIGIDAEPERMGESTSGECRRVLAEAGFTFSPGSESSGMVLGSKAKSEADWRIQFRRTGFGSRIIFPITASNRRSIGSDE